MRRKNKKNNYQDYQFNDYNYGSYNKQPEIKKKPKVSGVALICILNFIVFGISLGGNILIESFGNYYGYTFEELQLWRLLTNIFLFVFLNFPQPLVWFHDFFKTLKYIYFMKLFFSKSLLFSS